jgi:dihydrodipicolinate synthase/N-acetylneuraminate lyase
MDKRYPVTMMCGPCVPWTRDWEFDEAAFRAEVGYLVEHGVKSLYIFGTAGEGYAVNGRVFAQVVRAFVDECGKVDGVMPMTGIISTSLMEMLDRIAIGRELGCRDFQIALPCWGALSDAEVLDFFRLVCGRFPDCRFIHYNNGPRSKKLCTIDLYLKLAAAVPNLVAVKYSTSNMYEIYSIVSADCPLAFYMVDGGYTYGAMLGTCGFLNSFAAIDADLAWKYFYAGQNRDYPTLLDLDLYYKELNDCFLPVTREVIDSAMDKTIERVANNQFSNTLYPPYQGLTEEEFALIDRGMKAVRTKYRLKYGL